MSVQIVQKEDQRNNLEQTLTRGAVTFKDSDFSDGVNLQRCRQFLTN